MKKINPTFNVTKYFSYCFWLFLLIFLSYSASSQQTYTFTTAGATGSLGPTQLQINTAYNASNLNGAVVSNAGIQTWTVPLSGAYLIDARGAVGGTTSTHSAGLGARMQGEFNLIQGDVVRLIVGQMGETNASLHVGAGGGGSYVTVNNVLLIAAGGGGGGTDDQNGVDGTTATSGTQDNPPVSAGGTNGSGGATCLTSSFSGGGGGGYITGTPGNGQSVSSGGGGGLSFLNGGTGGGWNGTGDGQGGFGGGGGCDDLYTAGGGGGGYSGGAGGRQPSGCSGPSTRSGGGGGGSYNTGANQVNTPGVNNGDGLVIIKQLCSITLSTTGTSANGAMCAGGSVTITTNATSNYLWSNGSTASSIVVSPATNTTYSLTATSPSNCTASALVTITVNAAVPSLTVTNTANSGGICPNSTVNLTATGALSYTWTGGSPTVTNGVTFAPTAAHIYTVTGANGCGTSSAVTSVSVHPFPTVNTTASSSTLCSGSNLTLTATGNATNYVWTGAASTITNGVGFVPTTSTVFSVTGTSALGCTSLATVPVTVYITPTLAPVASPSFICLGSSSTLTAVGALSYTWASATQTVFTSTMAITPTGAGVTTYTITKASSVCTDVKTINVTTFALPTVAAVANPATACALSQVTLAAGGAQTYTWTAPGTPNYTFTGSSNVVVAPVSTTYSVAASDGTCVNIATVQLTITPNPTISISASSPSICSGKQVTLTAIGGNSYTWTTGSTTLTGTSITESPTSPVSYNVVGDNSGGCTAQASQIILVYSAPTITVSSDKNLVCNAGAVNFTATGASTYTWDPGAGSAQTNSVTVYPTSPVSGPVVYTVAGTSTVGCTGTKTVLVNVFIPTVSVSGNTNACKGGTISLSASGANSGSYNWNTGSGGLVSSQVLNTTITAPMVYTLTATSTSLSITCPVSQTIAAGLYPDPNIVATAERTTICNNEPVDLYASGGVSYTWNTGTSGGTITVKPTIQTTYTVTGIDNNGCQGTGTVQVKLSGCVGLNEHSDKTTDILVYPNPNNGEFSIRSDSDLSLTLVNELGQLIRRIELSTANDHKILVKDLSKGIYFITGQSGTTQINQKIIVTK